MKLILVISAAAAIMLTPAAFAQSSPSNSQSTNSQISPQQSANSNQNLTATRQIQQDLAKAGFTDVKVVAESFVVQAKSKDGDPVVMTIGPHGMSVFEAMNRSSGSDTSSQSKTTGSAPSSGSSSK